MKRSLVLLPAALLTIATSTAFARSMRHVEFSVTVIGIGTSKLRGSGLITPSEKTGEAKTAVSFKFEQDAASVLRPWHIHHGTCAKAGRILGGAALYPAIRTDAKGSGASKFTLPIVFPDTGVFYLSVHESAANMSKVIACGDLILED